MLWFENKRKYKNKFAKPVETNLQQTCKITLVFNHVNPVCLLALLWVVRHP